MLKYGNSPQVSNVCSLFLAVHYIVNGTVQPAVRLCLSSPGLPGTAVRSDKPTTD